MGIINKMFGFKTKKLYLAVLVKYRDTVALVKEVNVRQLIK